MVLMLCVLGGLTNMSTPTSAFVANLPPKWELSSDFSFEKELSIDLNNAFFDPDGDVLSFSVVPEEGVTAGIYDDVLIVFSEKDAFVTVSASDGKNVVSQRIFVYNQK